MVTRATAKKAMKKEKGRKNNGDTLKSRKLCWLYNAVHILNLPKLSKITKHF